MFIFLVKTSSCFIWNGEVLFTVHLTSKPYDWYSTWGGYHYNDVKMGAMAPQITSLTIVFSIVHSDADQRKHQSSASLAFVGEIHRWPVDTLHKGPVTRKMFPFDDVIMMTPNAACLHVTAKCAVHIDRQSRLYTHHHTVTSVTISRQTHRHVRDDFSADTPSPPWRFLDRHIARVASSQFAWTPTVLSYTYLYISDVAQIKSGLPH